MKNDPTPVRISCQFAGGTWIDVTSARIALYRFNDDSEREDHIHISTGTAIEKQRAIAALRAAAEFIESNLNAAEIARFRR